MEKEIAIKCGVDIDIKPMYQKIFGMEVWIDSSLKGNEFYIIDGDFKDGQS